MSYAAKWATVCVILLLFCSLTAKYGLAISLGNFGKKTRLFYAVAYALAVLLMAAAMLAVIWR